MTRMSIPRLTEGEMRELVLDRLGGRVMFSSEVPEDLVAMVFGCGLAAEALRPPLELVESLVGREPVYDDLVERGAPPKPEHPGWPESPEPPVKPLLAKVPDQAQFDHSWGDLSDEDFAKVKAEVKAENDRRIREWEDASKAWHDALAEEARIRSEIDATYDAAVKDWESSLEEYEELVAEGEEAHKAWQEAYDAEFSEWLADLGVLVGEMNKTFPRAINGYPIFHAFRIIHKEDWARIEAAILREQSREVAV